ncbi:hypothetical protein EDEG_01138, partial [Edhazardia aedis USNM 41457]
IVNKKDSESSDLYVKNKVDVLCRNEEIGKSNLNEMNKKSERKILYKKENNSYNEINVQEKLIEKNIFYIKEEKRKSSDDTKTNKKPSFVNENDKITTFKEYFDASKRETKDLHKQETKSKVSKVSKTFSGYFNLSKTGVHKDGIDGIDVSDFKNADVRNKFKDIKVNKTLKEYFNFRKVDLNDECNKNVGKKVNEKTLFDNEEVENCFEENSYFEFIDEKRIECQRKKDNFSDYVIFNDGNVQSFIENENLKRVSRKSLKGISPTKKVKKNYNSDLSIYKKDDGNLLNKDFSVNTSNISNKKEVNNYLRFESKTKQDLNDLLKMSSKSGESLCSKISRMNRMLEKEKIHDEIMKEPSFHSSNSGNILECNILYDDNLYLHKRNVIDNCNLHKNDSINAEIFSENELVDDDLHKNKNKYKLNDLCDEIDSTNPKSDKAELKIDLSENKTFHGFSDEKTPEKLQKRSLNIFINSKADENEIKNKLKKNSLNILQNILKKENTDFCDENTKENTSTNTNENVNQNLNFNNTSSNTDKNKNLNDNNTSSNINKDENKNLNDNNTSSNINKDENKNENDNNTSSNTDKNKNLNDNNTSSNTDKNKNLNDNNTSSNINKDENKNLNDNNTSSNINKDENKNLNDNNTSSSKNKNENDNNTSSNTDKNKNLNDNNTSSNINKDENDNNTSSNTDKNKNLNDNNTSSIKNKDENKNLNDNNTSSNINKDENDNNTSSNTDKNKNLNDNNTSSIKNINTNFNDNKDESKTINIDNDNNHINKFIFVNDNHNNNISENGNVNCFNASLDINTYENSDKFTIKKNAEGSVKNSSNLLTKELNSEIECCESSYLNKSMRIENLCVKNNSVYKENVKNLQKHCSFIKNIDRVNEIIEEIKLNHIENCKNNTKNKINKRETSKIDVNNKYKFDYEDNVSLCNEDLYEKNDYTKKIVSDKEDILEKIILNCINNDKIFNTEFILNLLKDQNYECEEFLKFNRVDHKKYFNEQLCKEDNLKKQEELLDPSKYQNSYEFINSAGKLLDTKIEPSIILNYLRNLTKNFELLCNDFVLKDKNMHIKNCDNNDNTKIDYDFDGSKTNINIDNKHINSTFSVFCDDENNNIIDNEAKNMIDISKNEKFRCDTVHKSKKFKETSKHVTPNNLNYISEHYNKSNFLETPKYHLHNNPPHSESFSGVLLDKFIDYSKYIKEPSKSMMYVNDLNVANNNNIYSKYVNTFDRKCDKENELFDFELIDLVKKYVKRCINHILQNDTNDLTEFINNNDDNNNQKIDSSLCYPSIINNYSTSNDKVEHGYIDNTTIDNVNLINSAIINNHSNNCIDSSILNNKDNNSIEHCDKNNKDTIGLTESNKIDNNLIESSDIDNNLIEYSKINNSIEYSNINNNSIEYSKIN